MHLALHVEVGGMMRIMLLVEAILWIYYLVAGEGEYQ